MTESQKTESTRQERTYSYRQYLEKFSRIPSDDEIEDADVTEDEPERIGRAIGEEIIKNLLSRS